MYDTGVVKRGQWTAIDFLSGDGQYDVVEMVNDFLIEVNNFYYRFYYYHTSYLPFNNDLLTMYSQIIHRRGVLADNFNIISYPNGVINSYLLKGLDNLLNFFRVNYLIISDKSSDHIIYMENDIALLNKCNNDIEKKLKKVFTIDGQVTKSGGENNNMKENEIELIYGIDYRDNPYIEKYINLINAYHESNNESYNYVTGKQG